MHYSIDMRTNLLSTSKGGSNFGVENKDKGSSDGTESVSTSSLEQSSCTFLPDDLLEAVNGSTVNPFLLGLLRLHLKPTADGVEWVRDVSGANGRSLGADKLGGCAEETVLILLVRVVSRKGIEKSKVGSTVRDDTGNGNSNTVVKTSDTRALDGLGDTVNETVELLLAGTDIGSKSGTGVIERVDNEQRSGSGQTTRGHVDAEEGDEVLVLVNLGENSLDGILEGKVESLGGEVSDDVGQVSTPESSNSLLGSDTGEAVNNTSVSGNLSRHNLGVGILSLDQKLDTLNGGGGGLGDGTGHTSGQKVDDEISSRRHVCERRYKSKKAVKKVEGGKYTQIY